MAEMKRFKLIGVALLVVFALSAVLASASQAETAPYFTIGGTRLVAGKTHNFDTKAFKAFKLSGGGLTVECKGQSTEHGVLLGSNAESPGKDNEIAVFSGCKLLAGNGEAEGCKLASETITTEPLKSEQVENVENSKGGKKLYEELFPAIPANGFVTLHFLPEVPPCEVLEATVSGQVVGESLLDTNEGSVELGQVPQERTSWLVKFPEVSIKEVWLISNGVGKIQKTKQLVFGAESVQTGTSLILLANTKFEPEPAAKWSPLP
jgi:hypothetical protein